MKYDQTYIKQSAIGVTGHVYEHVIANEIHTSLHARGYLPIVDYRLDAHTFDGIVVLSIETDNVDLLADVRRVRRDCNVSREVVTNAVAQISCEYERLPQFDADALDVEIRGLHDMPWIRMKDFEQSLSITDAARELTSLSLSFGRKSPARFIEHSIVYRVPDCPYELKPLAVYVLQTLGLAQINSLYRTVGDCYDSGDEWAEYQDLVGYVHKIRMPKSTALSIEALVVLEATGRRDILELDFVSKLVDYVIRHAAGAAPYFGTEAMFANAYQLIGQTGWERIASSENIQTILDKLRVEVV